jgi:hypothetical protein
MTTASVLIPTPEQLQKANKLRDDLNQQVRDEIGDDENIKFPQKNILLQKFGVIPPVLLPGWDQVAEDYDGRA